MALFTVVYIPPAIPFTSVREISTTFWAAIVSGPFIFRSLILLSVFLAASFTWAIVIIGSNLSCSYMCPIFVVPYLLGSYCYYRVIISAHIPGASIFTGRLLELLLYLVVLLLASILLAPLLFARSFLSRSAHIHQPLVWTGRYF